MYRYLHTIVSKNKSMQNEFQLSAMQVDIELDAASYFYLTIYAPQVLQARNNDILDVVNLINTLKDKFSEISCNIDLYQERWQV